MTNKPSQNQLSLKKLPKAKSVPLATALTTALALSSASMLAFAMVEINGSDSIGDLIKSAVIAATGGLVSFGVNRLGVEKGAPQAAIGVKGAAAVSIFSILFVGAGLFAATYAGFTLRETDEMRLRDHGRTVAQVIDQRARNAAEAGRIVPVLDSIVDDLLVKEACERQSSCLSGHGRGGVGPVSRMLSEKRQRAETVSTQVSEGDGERVRAVEQLNKLQARYQNALDDPELDRLSRRKALQAVNSEIGQQLSALDEAVPTALISAYVLELRNPVTIAGRRDASAKIGNLLNDYADSLNSTLHDTERGHSVRIGFPGKTGVADTFGYLGHFLPIAAIVAVVELIFPICLWLYTLFSLQARVVRDDPGGGETSPDPDSFSALVAMKPVAPETVTAKANGRVRRSKSTKEAA